MPIGPPSEILLETQPLSAATSPPLRASYAAAMKLADVEPSVSPAQPAASGVTETLQEALSSAYLTNPDLNAERAQLRATDEQVGVAKAGFRPTISASADTGYADTNNGVAKGSTIGQENFGTTGDISSDGVTHPRGLSVQLSQPLFKGFQNLNATRQAKASVQAGREGLNVIEQMTLLAAVTAYADVVRDQAIVRLRENNVTVLTALRTQIRGQFAAGIVTTTDVAQVEARLSGATAFLNAAQSDLRGSIATYEQVIGHPPGRLASPPSISKTLPKSIDEAMTQADAQNPLVLNSVYQEEASLYAVNQIVGELLPTVTLEAQYQHRGDLSNVLEEQEVDHGDWPCERAALPRRRCCRPGSPGQTDQPQAQEAGRIRQDLKRIPRSCRTGGYCNPRRARLPRQRLPWRPIGPRSKVHVRSRRSGNDQRSTF